MTKSQANDVVVHCSSFFGRSQLPLSHLSNARAVGGRDGRLVAAGLWPEQPLLAAVFILDTIALGDKVEQEMDMVIPRV